MSARQVETQISAVHPRETTELFGHRAVADRRRHFAE